MIRSPCRNLTDRPFRPEGGADHWEIEVPVFPAMPSLAFSSRVIRAVRPGLDSANFTAAWTLGSMEPGANWPSASYFLASAGVRWSSHCWSGLPKLTATFSTAVRMMSASASSSSASSSEAKSLSMTAPAPLRWLPSVL